MAVYAITGELACGKSTVLKLLKKKGAMIFSVDECIHDYYRNKRSPVYKKVAVCFPQAHKRGIISRRALSMLVFSDQRKRRKLESIVHPQAIKDVTKWIKGIRSSGAIGVVEVPLLFEKKLQKHFDGVIVVYAARDILYGRIRKKYKLSRMQAQRRLGLFMPISRKIALADFVVTNTKSTHDLKKEVLGLWKRIKQK